MAPGRPAEGQRIHIVDYLAGTIGLQHIAMDTFTPFTIPGSVTCIAGTAGHTVPQTASNKGPPIHSTPPSPLRTLAPGKSAPYTSHVAIHPGSGSTRKCWPARNFAAVIEQLMQRNIRVLLLAGPADDERVHDMLGNLSLQLATGMLKVLENAPLLEVADHLQRCRGYLGNDSGITHLAAMLGVPTLALFGPSDPVTWRPVGPCVLVIQEYPLDRLHVNVAIDTMNSFYLNRTVEGDRTSGM